MRWEDKKERKGRTSWKGFLWIPTLVMGEWRWLETARILRDPKYTIFGVTIWFDVMWLGYSKSYKRR